MSNKGNNGHNNSNIKEGFLIFRLGYFGAIIPMMFFMFWAVILSILKIVTEEGLIIGAIIGVSLGMFLCRSSWKEYAQGIFEGMTQTVGIVAIVAWFWAGMFASVLQEGGLVEGLVWVGIHLGVQGSMFTMVAFILSALFATAVGTGYGTVVAFCMLLYPAGIAIGSDPVVLLGAILSGAAFGDNLAPVSDTTIVSAVTQRTDIIGVVRSRFKYAVAAAIPAMILFLIFGGSDMAVKNDILSTGTFGRPEGLILLVPFILVLLIAYRGYHIITSLTWGIISSIVLIYIADLCPMKEILWFNLNEGRVEGALLDGVLGYVNMAVLILLVVALGYIVNIGGTMDAIRRFTISKIKGVVARAEIAMWALIGLLNSLITINTAAEILASTFVYDIGKELKIHPYRRANFLDSMTSALGYIFPWAGGTLLGIVTIQGLTSKYSFVHAVNPIEVIPYVFHGWLLVIVMLFAAITGWGRRFIGPNGEEVKNLKD